MKAKQYWLDEERLVKSLTAMFKESDEYKAYGEEVDDFIDEYVSNMAKSLVDDMDKYVHMSDKNIPWRLTQIDLNWNKDHKHLPDFEHWVRMMDAGVVDAEFLEHIHEWTESWFYKTFGTYDMKYNFGYDVDEFILSERKNDFMNNQTRYRMICFVQDGEDLEVCSQLFQGDAPDYMVGGYSQPVIDYLKQRDDDEWDDDDISSDVPRCSPNDTEYEDENGEYTLRYDNSLGGVFMLYRETNSVEDRHLWDNMEYEDQMKKR